MANPSPLVEGLVGIYLVLPAEMRMTIGWLMNQRNLFHRQSQNDRPLRKPGDHICPLSHQSGRHLLKSGRLAYYLHRSGHPSINDPLHLPLMHFRTSTKSDKNVKQLAREGGRGFGEDLALFRQSPPRLQNKI